MKHNVPLVLRVETWVPCERRIATEEISPSVAKLLTNGGNLVGHNFSWNGFKLRVQKDQRESPCRVLTLIQLPVGNWGQGGLLETLDE